jgi:hypothetical protein
MTLSDTSLGAIIGVGGVLIGLVFNFVFEILRYKHENTKELRVKKCQVYLGILQYIDDYTTDVVYRVGKSQQEIAEQHYLLHKHVALYASPKVVKMYNEFCDWVNKKSTTEAYLTDPLINQIRIELGNRPILKSTNKGVVKKIV